MGCETPVSYSDPDSLAALISGQEEPYFLVDVRTHSEYTAGHIPTAINIPLDEIGGRPPTTDTSALIIVYCASGHRSAAAAQTLAGMGYTRVVDFGAITRWRGSLVTGDSPQ